MHSAFIMLLPTLYCLPIARYHKFLDAAIVELEQVVVQAEKVQEELISAQSQFPDIITVSSDISDEARIV